MKNLILFILLCLPIFSFAQTLENTSWQLYLDGYYENDVRFGTDTFHVDLSPEIPFSTFTINSDTITIFDLPGLGCSGFFDVFGTYTFTIQNDTLDFVLINDDCEFRKETLGEGVYVRIGTAVKNLSPSSEVLLYPNPFANEVILKTKNMGNGKVQILFSDMLGRELYFEEEVVGFGNEIRLTKNMEQLQAGLIFYQVTVDGKVYTGRLVKF